MGSWCSSAKTTDTNRGRRGLRRPEDKPRKDDNDVDEPYKNLKVEDIDLLIDENSKDHHTDTYVLTDSKAKLVIRRGHPFRVRIRFSRKVNWREDNLRIDFSAGSFPQHADGTLVQIPLSENESFDPRGKWKAEKLEEKDSELEVKIHTPSDCIVYKWLFRIEILEEKDGKNIVHVNKKIFPINMYTIFNPWNKADTVYLEDKDLRQEYVLNDEGAIWVGDPTDYRTWSFGQFEKNVLDCTMYLLDLIDLSSFSMKARASPVLVSRRLSAVGNGFDNDGLLEGNWSGEYQGGTSPTKWRGSVKIMQQFWKTKAPVKYGQCWVFSGVLTTRKF